MIRPIPGFRVPWAIFSPKTNSYGNLRPRFQASLLLHLEFLIHLLIGPIFKTPCWIWKSMESVVLETIAYCLFRLLIGYRSYKPGIVVTSSRSLVLRLLAVSYEIYFSLTFILIISQSRAGLTALSHWYSVFVCFN